MAQHLVVDVRALADMGTQLGRIKDDFDHIETITRGAEDYVGDHDVAAAVEEFSTNWSDKRLQIAALLGGTAAAVTRAAIAYEQTDEKTSQHVGGVREPVHGSAGEGADPPDHHHDSAAAGGGGTTGGGGSAPVGGSGGDAGTADSAGNGGTSHTGADPAAGSAPGAGTDPAAADPAAAPQQLTGDGAVSDSGAVGLSAHASGGAAAAARPGHSGLDMTNTAAMAAPVGMLGAAGAAAWAAQRRKDNDSDGDTDADNADV